MRHPFLTTLLLTGVIFSSCNKDDDNPSPAPGGGGSGGGGNTTISAATMESVSYTMDGTNYSYVNGAANIETYFSTGGSQDKEYGCGFYSAVTGSTIIEFFVGRFQLPAPGIPTSTQFFSWFNTGVVPYGNVGTEQNKAEVRMYDGSPLFTEWSSRCGTQAGATFNITQVVQIPSSITYDRVKFRVTFNCKVYNCSSGAERTLTNGTAVVSMENNI